MTDPTPVQRQDHSPPTGPLLTMAALALVALGASSLLWYHATLAGPDATLPGCGGQSTAWIDCQSVLRSPWSLWLGKPVSGPAITFDLTALGLMMLAGAGLKPRLARYVQLGLLVVAGALLGGAAWFIFVQAALLHQFCLYCMIAHAAGAALAVMILRYHASRPRAPTMTALAALLTIAVLVAGRYVLQPKPAIVEMRQAEAFDTGPGPNRQLSVMNGLVRFNPHDYPIIGSPDADHILIYLFDYACPHCRKLHVDLQAAVARYGNQLGIVTLPAPLNPACNPEVKNLEPRFENSCILAKLALAVWIADPAKFPEFDHWLFATEDAPTPQAATDQARRLIGPAALEKAMQDPRVDQKLQNGVLLYKLAGAGQVPKILSVKFIAISRPSPEDLRQLLETQLHIKPVATQPAG